ALWPFSRVGDRGEESANRLCTIAAGELRPAQAAPAPIIKARTNPTAAVETIPALPRIYVPNRRSNDVTAIDPATLQVVDRFKVGVYPQHIVPSWDLKTLWVA